MRVSYLAAFSLPDTIAHPVARSAMAAAIMKFSFLDKTPQLTVNNQQFVVYRAYLGPLGRITITQHIVSGGSRSYLQFERAAMLSQAKRSPKRQIVLVERMAA